MYSTNSECVTNELRLQQMVCVCQEIHHVHMCYSMNYYMTHASQKRGYQ